MALQLELLAPPLLQFDFLAHSLDVLFLHVGIHGHNLRQLGAAILLFALLGLGSLHLTDRCFTVIGDQIVHVHVDFVTDEFG